MCGIVGAIGSAYTSATEKKMFKQLLIVDQLRGQDSTGMVAITGKQQGQVAREVGTPDVLLSSKRADQLLNDGALALIGHNRYATVGNITRETAHPFVHKTIAMVHNGTLDPGWEKRMPDGHAFDVDSEAVCYSLAVRGAKETVESLEGAFCLVWYDANDHTLNMCRNDQRPMYLAHITAGTCRGSMLYASEVEMLELVLERNNIYKWEIEKLPTDVIRSWKCGGTDSYKYSDEKVTLVDDWMNYGKKTGGAGGSAGTAINPPAETGKVHHLFTSNMNLVRTYQYVDMVDFEEYAGSTDGTGQGIGYIFGMPKTQHYKVRIPLMHLPHCKPLNAQVAYDEFVKGDIHKVYIESKSRIDNSYWANIIPVEDDNDWQIDTPIEDDDIPFGGPEESEYKPDIEYLTPVESSVYVGCECAFCSDIIMNQDEVFLLDGDEPMHGVCVKPFLDVFG